jgi:hypothetical protein
MYILFKIFGPGKKLGGLIIFTMCLLLITSCVSMQLFCSLTSDKYRKFETFSQVINYLNSEREINKRVFNKKNHTFNSGINESIFNND